MTRRGELTSCQPQPTGAFIAVPAARPFGGAQSSWRRTLSAIVAAGGCALFAAMAVVADAKAQIQASEFPPAPGRSAGSAAKPAPDRGTGSPCRRQCVGGDQRGRRRGARRARRKRQSPSDLAVRGVPTPLFRRSIASGAVSPGRAARPRAGCARLRLISTRWAMSSPTATSSRRRRRSPSFFRTIPAIPPG